MALDPSIPGRVVPLTLGQSIMEGRAIRDDRQDRQQQIGIDEEKMGLLREDAARTRQKHQMNMKAAREAEFFSRTVPVASEVLRLIQAGDMDTAKKILDDRILKGAAQTGEKTIDGQPLNYDDTREIREQLDTNPALAQAKLRLTLAEGKTRGISPVGRATVQRSDFSGVGAARVTSVVMNNGDQLVTDAMGQEIPQDQIAAKLEEAALSEITSAEKKQATLATAKLRSDRFRANIDELKTLGDTLSLYDEAIVALESGAKTGAIDRHMSIFNAQTRALENVQMRLGFNYLQAVTFGALSEKELDAVTATAIPTGIDEPELMQWLDLRRSATVKYRNFLMAGNSFMMTHDDPQDWIDDLHRRQQDAEREREAERQRGQTTTVEDWDG